MKLCLIKNVRSEDTDIEYRNTTAFTVRRYQDIVEAISDGLLSDNDRKIITESRDFQTIQEEMQNKRLDPTISSHSRRLLNQLQPLPRTLNDLERFFQHAVHPEKLPMESLWGLLYLNFMVISY
jgi:serine phosphatase RsbU (regulator of sigma subunit)